MEINLIDLPSEKFFIGMNKDFNKKIVEDFRKKSSPLYINCKNILGVSDTHFSSMYKKQQYPLQILLKLINFLEIDIKETQKHVSYIKTGNGSDKRLNIKFPIKLSKQLARTIAHILGDGCLSIQKNTISSSYYNQNKLLRECFKKDIYYIFGINQLKEGINKTTNYVAIPSSASWILSILVKDFNSKTSRVPEFIKTSPIHIKKEFIRAFLDDEAHVAYRPPNRYIEVALSNKFLLEDLKELIREFEIDTSKTYYKNLRGFDIYYFYIRHNHNLEKYSKEIGFLHSKKILSLQKILENPGRKSYAHGKTEEMIVRLIGKGLKTSKELATTLDRKVGTIQVFLNKLQQKRIIKKEGFKKVGVRNKEIIWEINKNGYSDSG